MILPRLIRIRDAPAYLGMDRKVFNALVRPVLTEVRIGTQGIAFDRLDLDAWADEHIQLHGKRKGAVPCEERGKSLGFKSTAPATRPSTSASMASASTSGSV